MSLFRKLFRWKPTSDQPQGPVGQGTQPQQLTPQPKTKPINQLAEPRKPGWMNRLSGSTVLYFLILAAVVVLLASFSIGVFFPHIDAQGIQYGWFRKAAVVGVELTILYLVFRHVFDAFRSVRFYALFAGLALSLIVLAHNGAMLTHDVAVNQNTQMVKQLGEEYRKLNESSQKGLIDSGTSRSQELIGQKKWESGRDAFRSSQNASSANVRSAQENLAKFAEGGQQRAQNSTFLPDWYFRGLAYFVIFASAILALVGLGLINEKAQEQFEAEVRADPSAYYRQPPAYPVRQQPGFATAQNPKDEADPKA